ncbi:MAG: ATP-binding cassette domain-containing protein [Eggerthellaceae bacterium]|nr:ATP-binding cassette domain-containing protein [Eggerthellaceae bacterium]
MAIIIGPGSGKSTILDLIPRFCYVTSGDVLIDGVNIKKHNLKHLRILIGHAQQKTFLFSGNINSNIQFECSKEISRGGSNVSIGQRQLLAIPR